MWVVRIHFHTKPKLFCRERMGQQTRVGSQDPMRYLMSHSMESRTYPTTQSFLHGSCYGTLHASPWDVSIHKTHSTHGGAKPRLNSWYAPRKALTHEILHGTFRCTNEVAISPWRTQVPPWSKSWSTPWDTPWVIMRHTLGAQETPYNYVRRGAPWDVPRPISREC